MENQKLDKASSQNQIQGPGVGYVWERHQHPRNARPKAVPLTK